MLKRLSVPLFLMLPGLAAAEQPEAPPGGSPICVWEIYVTLLNHAEICKLDARSDMHAAMKQSVADIGRFITENSEIRAASLESAQIEILIKQRNNYRATLYDYGLDVCDRAADETVSNMYRNVMTDQSPDELRAWTRRFVSVPRDPRQGGCL